MNAARDGIDDVKIGNTVKVSAVVADDKATARSVNDGTVRHRPGPLGVQAAAPADVHSRLTGKIQGSHGQRRQTGDISAHLLVVDDEPNIVELLSASLRFAGYDVSTAATAARHSQGPGGGARPGRARRDDARPGRLRGGPPAAREDRHVPVLFLTARDAVEDKVPGCTPAATTT